MPVNPFIFNLIAVGAFLKDYKGAVRNLIFIIIFLVVTQLFGQFVFNLASGVIIENSPNPNFILGITAIVLIIADFGLFLLKYPSLTYFAFQHRQFIAKDSGCLLAVESSLLGLSIFFNFIPTALLFMALSDSFHLDEPYLELLFSALVFLKWLIIFKKSIMLTPSRIDGLKKIPENYFPTLKNKLINVSITVISSINYIIVWEVCGVHNAMKDYQSVFPLNRWGYSVNILLELFFFSIVMYLPIRLIFILEDYYSVTTPKQKRAAFLSSVLAVIIPIISAAFKYLS